MSLNKSIPKIGLMLLSVPVTLLILEPVLRICIPLRFRPDQPAPLYASTTYRLSENKELVYEQKPNSDVVIDGIDYGINAYGFRDREYRPASSQDKRVVCVGDSLTYGWLVPLMDTYHKQLEHVLKAENRSVEVMGMGVVGYNLVQEYHLIKDKAARLNPDLIVLQIGPNDFERTVAIKTVQETGKFVLLPYHDVNIPYVMGKTKFTGFLMRHSHLFKLLNLALYPFAEKRDKGYQPRDVYLLGEERSFQYLTKIIDFLDGKKIPLAVVLFPRQNHGGPYLFASLTQRIHRHLDLRRIPTLDLYDRLNAGTETDLFMDGLHLTAKGNALAGRTIADFIRPLLFGK